MKYLALFTVLAALIAGTALFASDASAVGAMANAAASQSVHPTRG